MTTSAAPSQPSRPPRRRAASGARLEVDWDVQRQGSSRRGRTAVVVMGVSGSGKSTLAHALADHLGWGFADADDLHSADNIARMSAGIALSDADRLPWLHALRDWMTNTIPARPADLAGAGGAVLTCSALRRSYRDVLRQAPVQLHFVHLDGTLEQLSARLATRTGHFMPASLLTSQLAALEPLRADEEGLTLSIDATVKELIAQVLNHLELAG